jgi:hypothetical protein
MLGLETEATGNHIAFAPHLPANWSSFAIHNIRTGTAALNLDFRRTPDEITLQIESSDTAQLHFSPAASLRAQVISAELNGRRVPFKIETNSSDQHVNVDGPLIKGKNTIRIRSRNDVAIGYSNVLPALGSSSHGLRIISESWSGSRDTVTLELAGTAASTYELSVWNPGQVASVVGAQLHDGMLLVTFPSQELESYTHQKVTIHFAGSNRRR